MKKYLLSILVLLTAFGVSSCKPEKSDEPASLQISPTSIVFSATTESKTVTIDTNRSWQISDIPEWLSVEPSQGQAGKTEVKLISKENKQGEERQVRLSVKAEKIAYINVKQTVKGFLNVKDREFLFFAKGKKVIINCEGNINPELVIPQDAKSWLSFVSNDVKKDGRIILDMADNNDIPRQAEVKIIDKTNNISETVTIKQYPDPKVKIEKESYYLFYNLNEFVLEFDSNIPFEHTLEPTDADWISIKSMTFEDKKVRVVFSLKTNTGKTVRKASLTLRNVDCDKTYVLHLTQAYRAEAGLAVQIHKATYRPKIDWEAMEKTIKRPTFVFTGDGFTKADIESGRYQKVMMEAYEALFSTEPYKTLKDRFSAWILYAESNEQGITTIDEYEAGKRRDTHYGVYFYDRSRGMRIDNYGEVHDECKTAVEKAGGKYYPETSVIVMIANTPIYGGTCLLETSSGRAIAICPTSEGETDVPGVFGRIVAHEAGGHGFGKLADEYTVGGGIDELGRRHLKAYHDKKHYINVTMESDRTKAPWAWMYGLEGYEDVDHIEGGETYATGVWRSSRTSLMKDNRNVSDFNAFSRFLIFERLYYIYENIDNLADVLPPVFRPKPLKEWFLEIDKPNTRKK